MITIEKLSKSFGKLQVLKDISLAFEAGQAVSLIGPNASGKTTLIKSILGMVVPDTGQIRVAGQSISDGFAYRQQIGYMPQIGRYPDNMTIRQVFDMIKELRLGRQTPDNSPDLDEELIHSFGLIPLFQQPMRTLSGGTRQKVSAALAFLFKPGILILDEPTAGLDPLAADILKEKIIQEKKKGRLILITSHILSDMEDIATNVLYIMEGNVLFFKTVEQIKKETCEQKLEKAIVKIMASVQPSPVRAQQ